VLGAELFEAVHAGVDDVEAGGVGEADGGISAEGLARNGGDLLFAEQFLAEVDGIDAHGFDVDQEVEGAEGFHHFDVPDVGEAAEHVLAADIELVTHVTHDLLVALESGDGAVLGEGGGVGGGVALQHVDGGSDFLRSGGVTEAPAGHGVGFGETVDGDGEVGDFLAEGSDGDVGLVGVNEFFVDFVGQDEDVFAHGDVGDGLKLFLGVNGAGGVAGAVDDDHLGEGGHGVLELIRGHFPAVFALGFDDDGDAADEANHFRVAGPVRGGDDDFVAWIDGGCDGVVAGVLGAAVDADLGRVVLEAVIDEQLGGEGFTKFEEAAALGVAGFAFGQGLDGSLDDVFRGIKIWFASAKAENIHALLFQHLGCVGNSKGH